MRLISLLDLVFEGDDETSLVANLRNVDKATWNAVPQGGGRTIAQIASRAGLAPWVYADFAFGAGGQTWGPAVADVVAAARSMAQSSGCARATAASSRRSQLSMMAFSMNYAPFVGVSPPPLRKLVAALVSHASYHAGEINHARSLIRGTDRWDYFA